MASVDERDLPTGHQILGAPYGVEAQAKWKTEVIEQNRQARIKREQSPRYVVVQSKVNTDSWYVDDTDLNKTVAVFLSPFGQAYAEHYAVFMNFTPAPWKRTAVEK